MKRSIESENQFVVDLLTTLRNEKFSPPGWGRFLWRSWQMSCQTADNNPTLKRSWMWVTIWIGMLAIAMLVSNALFEGISPTLRLLPGFLGCVLWQQSDLFWHLGLNRHAKTGILLPTVGFANTCTWLRGLGTAYLLGRLVGGLATHSGLVLLVFLCGSVTDILDGQIARRTGTQSKLGQIGDAEADFCLYLAITIILLQNAVLPLWLGVVMLLRFAVPLLAALASYFLFAHLVRFGSTIWGKYAGLAQCLYFLVLLTPPQFIPIAHFINFPLLIVTLFLLLAAPTAQIVQNVKAMSKE
nr:CDP-alcohol phosphatidyltransferase family protein [Ktedonobacteraceae bacterium]